MSKRCVWFFMLLLTVVFLFLSAGCGTQPEPATEPAPTEPAEPARGSPGRSTSGVMREPPKRWRETPGP